VAKKISKTLGKSLLLVLSSADGAAFVRLMSSFFYLLQMRYFGYL